MILTDKQRPYPRICAHRGFNTIAPENSMPAFGAAVAMGADEIEFDLWWTADGEIVSIHDPVLDRVSDGTGYVYEHSYRDLLRYDFGIKTAPEFAGLRILRFEEILERLACRTIMNIHLKSAAEKEHPEAAWVPPGHLEKIVSLIRKYHAEEFCYFKVGEHEILQRLTETASEITRCAGAGTDPHEDYAETALRYGCGKIQLFKPHFKYNPPDYLTKMIEKCHRNNIRVNYFWTDDPEEAVRVLEAGADTVLTNDYHRVAEAAGRWRRQRENTGTGE